MNKVIIFSVPLLFIIMVSCGQKDKAKVDTTPKVEIRDMKGLKIAFYNSDSLKVQFNFFKEQEDIVNKRQKKFESELERRQKEYQEFIIRNNQRLQNNELSENQAMQIQQRAQQMEAEIVQYQQTEGARLEKETIDKLEAIRKKIETYGKQFSEENGIDILLIHGQGGQINYINATMDVTKEFTEYLNQREVEIEKDIKK